MNKKLVKTTLKVLWRNHADLIVIFTHVFIAASIAFIRGGSFEEMAVSWAVLMIIPWSFVLAFIIGYHLFWGNIKKTYRDIKSQVDEEMYKEANLSGSQGGELSQANWGGIEIYEVDAAKRNATLEGLLEITRQERISLGLEEESEEKSVDLKVVK